MDIDKLMKITETLLKDTDKLLELDEGQEFIAREKGKLFDRVLSENEDFIFEACGGEMKDATPEEKGACFKVLCDLNEILYIQDQMEMPN
jgi:hypothetical protein